MNSRPRICLTFLFAFFPFVCGEIAWGQTSCCAQCGCVAGCQRVCRLKCEEKRVTETLWAGKSEEICLPGKSRCVDQQCEMIGDQVPDAEVPCAQPKKFVWNLWQPITAPTSATKSKLMKRTIVKTIPSYRWVVEDLCPDCEATAKTNK